MRVISGRYRGRPLFAAKVPGLRPTADRVREALFSILGDIVLDAKVLDLFAGTGALAIEAVSRGAREATCVEQNRRVLQALDRNVASLELDREIWILRADALDYCRRMSERDEEFDVVFCDPPYDTPLEPLGDVLVNAEWWTRVCVLEHEAGLEPPVTNDGTFETRRYGDTALTLYWRL